MPDNQHWEWRAGPTPGDPGTYTYGGVPVEQGPTTTPGTPYTPEEDPVLIGAGIFDRPPPVYSCSGPDGVEGGKDVVDGQWATCTNGQWVHDPKGIPTPGGFAAACQNPNGAEGDYSQTTGLRCEFGQWVSPTPDYRIPPGEGGPVPSDIPQGPKTPPTTPPVSPWQVGSPQWWEETTGDPQAGYLASLGLWGQESLGPYQRYLSSQYAPLEMLRGLSGQSQLLGMPGPGMGGGLMADWGSQYAQAPGSMYGLATQQLGNVFGMTPSERDIGGMREGAGNFGQLLSMGMREFLGPAAGWLGGRIPQMQQSWMSQYPQQMGPSFMDFIIQKYNLGRFFPGGFPASQGGQVLPQGAQLGGGAGGYNIQPGI